MVYNLGEMQNIIVDCDSNIGYETNSTLKSVFNLFFIPILNSLPSGLREIVKKTNKPAKDILENVTTHAAIEILYQEGQPHRVRNLLQRFFHYIWFSTNNPKAVRNRLRLVERELIKAIKNSIANRDEISILSVASGSARAIIESVDNPEFLNHKISVAFLDKSSHALEYSRKLISTKHFPNNFSFRWIEDLAKKFHAHYEGMAHPNIIETVGLMDYFNDDKVLEFFSHVYTHLRKGGTFITANIADNPERKFVTNLVGWEMIYRQPEEFLEIAMKAGFKKENIQILLEPLKVHFVMIAKK